MEYPGAALERVGLSVLAVSGQSSSVKYLMFVP